MCSAIPRPRLVLRSAWPQAWRKAWRLHFALAVAVALLCCGPFGPFGPFGSYVATFASGSSESRREVLGALLGAGLTPTPARAESVIKQMASESRKLSDALKSGKPVIVDFAADWCPDCQQMAPVLLDLKQQVGNAVEFVTLDVTYAAPGSTLPRILENDIWAKRFGVDGLPHVAFIDSQRHVQTALVGDVPPNVVRADVEALVKGTDLPFIMYDAFEGQSNTLE